MTMKLISNNCTDPSFNLALDEHLLTGKQGEYFMLWRNEPSVIIGRNQDALAEVNLDFLKSNSIHLVRRMSGGGAVFHDLGNINFTYITHCEQADFFNFARFAAPIVSALNSLGINAEMSGRNDMSIDGKKFSGNAQHMSHGRILHHGTLLYNSDFSYMQGALNVDPEKLKGKGVSSVRSRVTNIASHMANPMSTEQFLQYLSEHIMGYFDGIEHGSLTEEDLQSIARLQREKYQSDSWNLLHRGNYELRKSARFDSGGVTAALTVKQGVIVDIAFVGDFFGLHDIAELERALCGVTHTKEAVEQALSCIEVGDYISKLSSSELVSLLF